MKYEYIHSVYMFT